MESDGTAELWSRARKVSPSQRPKVRLHAKPPSSVIPCKVHCARAILLLSCALLAVGESPKSLYRKARAAEEKGDYRQAWTLANQALALEPGNAAYWGYATALRTRGLEGARIALPPAPSGAAQADLPPISDEDLKETKELLPPPILQPNKSVRSFDLQGDSKKLFEEVLKAYGLEVVFDGDYQPVRSQRFRIDNATCADALRALEAVTASFAIAVNERIALVAKDTAQKRQELEPTMAVTIPFPEPIAVQEIQEAARAVQSTFDMQKMGIDNQRRLILFRDRVSRLRPAIALFQQLMAYRGQVMVDVELLTVSETSTLNYGANLQTSYNLVYFGSNRLDGSGPLPNIPSGLTGNFLTFGKGNGMFGVGLTDATFFAAMTRGATSLLNRTSLLSLEGQPATFHLGDRYPVITQQFTGAGTGQEVPENAYRPPPTIQFEDLGVLIKITPWLHGADEVTLELNAEYKVLAGEALNGIPVISNRKFESRVRLRFGQSAVVAGLLSQSLSKTKGGFPLLGPLAPFLNSNTTDRTRQDLLIVLTPKLTALPPSLTVTSPLWVGTETRPLTPIGE